MSKPSSSSKSRTDWVRVRSTKERDIVLTADHPEASAKHIVRGIVRRGLKPIPPKAVISLRVDADVLDWFKAQVNDAGGGNYQSLINDALKGHIQQHGLERTLRRLIREELRRVA